MAEITHKPTWALNLREGALVSPDEAARERRALVLAYVAAWIFGAVVFTIYCGIYESLGWKYAVGMALIALGLAYGLVIFNPRFPRQAVIFSPMIVVALMFWTCLYTQQPGANAFLLVPLIFNAFFLWRHPRLYWFSAILIVVAYISIPLAIGGTDELRRVVIGGPIFASITVMALALVQRAGRMQMERSTFQSTVTSLLTALNARSGAGQDRTIEMVELAERVAGDMGLGDLDCEQARYAAFLHDIGKLGVPNELLDKSEPLSADEWEVMRQHPVIGERIVSSVPGFEDVAVIVRGEHEWWNGKGYPDGLSGDHIPVESRIINACDAYVDLVRQAAAADTTAREPVALLNELNKRSGTQFDPDVLHALGRVVLSGTDFRPASMLERSLRLAS
ncbi:MAG: HD domain-containing protein [Thermoleophilaceae bacterium]|nr:HD domain-containing protein [Thermoleophilaceae bacterium]